MVVGVVGLGFWFLDDCWWLVGFLWFVAFRCCSFGFWCFGFWWFYFGVCDVVFWVVLSLCVLV